ncbi:MAG: hypothetical protein ACOYVD_15230 [Bacillota bacterium]
MFRKAFASIILLVILMALPSIALANEGAIIKIGQGVQVAADEVFDAVVSIGGNVVVDGKVKDAVVVIGGDVNINGTVNESVVVIGGDAYVNNKVMGDLVVIGGIAGLGPQAVIYRDLVMIGVELTKDPAAQIKGAQTEVSITDFMVDFPKNFAFFGISLATFLMGLLLIGSIMMSLLVLLVGLVFPDALQRSKAFALNSLGKSFLLGLLFAVFFLPITFVLFITIIGIPLLLLFWFAYGAAAIWGTAVIAEAIGDRATSFFNYQGDSHILKLIIGILIIIIISQIPFVGWLFVLLLKIMAIGIAAISHLGFRQI